MYEVNCIISKLTTLNVNDIGFLLLVFKGTGTCIDSIGDLGTPL